MGGGRPSSSDDDWSPLTSQPGEIHTPEGRIRAFGAMARGAANDDPRLRPYRRSMLRGATLFFVIGAALFVVVAIIAAIF